MAIKFSFGKCKTRAGYSSKLQQKGRLNLKKVAKMFEVVMETPILLVIKAEEIEIIVHSYGELLFKDCDDAELMESVARKIYECGFEKK